MKRNWILAAGLAALGGALAIPALAHGDGEGDRGHGSGCGDHAGMMQMMERMRGQGMGSMGMMGGPGAMRAMGPMGAMMEAFDADGDGTATPDEMRAGLEARLTEFDGDGDGTLSLDEFETLYAAMTREITVDRFQELDNDGDGQVTADEITAPADRMERMQVRRDRRMQQAPDGATMPMRDMEDGMMDDDAPGDE